MPTKEGPLAAWLHLPAEGARGGQLAVLCYPIGFEYTHAYRTLRRLADGLAAKGVMVLRFDYQGSGNSPGDTERADLANRWMRDIENVVGFGRSELGATRVTLVGLRLGGLLAAAVAKSTDADALVLWSPIVKGRRYMREWQALARVGGPTDEDVLEAGGFVLPQDAATEIGALGLDSVDMPEGLEVLWVKRDDLPEKDVSEVLGERVSSFDAIATEGFADMIAEPHFTEIPHSTVAAIAAWTTRESAEEGAGKRSHADAGRFERTRIDADTGIREQLVTVTAEHPLFGVLTSPATGAAPDAPLLLLLNAGSVHTVGPNRIYVEIARELARQGVPSLRLDLRNLGDSLQDPGPDENHPYPDTAVADAMAAIAWAGEHHTGRIVVGGICSGAFTAYQTAVSAPDSGATEYLPINPLTFEWREGMSLATPPPGQVAARETQYYRSAVRDPARWKKLARGQVDFRAIGTFIGRRFVDRVRAGASDLMAVLGVDRPSELARDLEHVVDGGRRITFVFSSSDPGLELLNSCAGRTVRKLALRDGLQLDVVPAADHTFSRRSWRRALIELLIRRLGGKTSH